jgi:hypothetical protein
MPGADGKQLNHQSENQSAKMSHARKTLEA